jgi:hypothetical protein
MWDSYQNVVENLKEKGLTEGITITSHYEDRQGEQYETTWTINPCFWKEAVTRSTRATRTRCKALEDQARVLEKNSYDLEELKGTIYHRHGAQES